MHTFLRIHIVALILAAAGQAHDSSTRVTPDFIKRLIGEAAASHPSVEAAEARSQAATAAIGAVRLWEDPELGLGTQAPLYKPQDAPLNVEITERKKEK